MPKKNAHILVVSILFLLLMIQPAKARILYFQPRLEAGFMQYEFESEAISRAALPVYNATVSSFKYKDILPFVSGGMTFFIDRVSLDISGQYAFDGNDTTTLQRSGFQVSNVDVDNQSIASLFTAMDSQSEVTFDRTDMAVSLGYQLTENFGLFIGYKQSKTEFFEKFNGLYSINFHGSGDRPIDGINAFGGRMVGSANYKFEYAGPFIGCVQGFDFSKSGFLKGTLTANVALAHLEGKLASKDTTTESTVQWIDDQKVTEFHYSSGNANLGGRMDDTKGDALGLKVALTWQGTTPWEGLTYVIGMSGYRYEFKSGEYISDMNETAINLKMGLTYLF